MIVYLTCSKGRVTDAIWAATVCPRSVTFLSLDAELPSYNDNN